MTDKPKIVTVVGTPIEVGTEPIGAEYIVTLRDFERVYRYNTANATALRDALTAALDKGER